MLNPLFIGTPGTGKTFLARALAYKACLEARRVIFTPAAKMLKELAGAEAHGRFDRVFRKYAAAEFLVIDDARLARNERHAGSLGLPGH